MAKYPTHEEDEWIRPKRQGYKMMCCDCGLVHKIFFRLIKIPGRNAHKIEFKMERDNRATGQARRWKKKNEQTR